MKEKLKKKIAEIKEIQQLNFEHDNQLFIDPYRINERDGELAQEAKRKIIKFFDIFFKCIKDGNREKVLLIGKYLHEVNATKLGYTKPNTPPNGKGFSQKDLVYIYDEAKKIEKSIEDMPDVFVLAENVGPDKISDITTNIIYEELLQFTIGINHKYNLNLEFVEKSKYIFDVGEEKWTKKKFMIPTIDGEEILFLPKNIVESYEIFSYETFYKQLVYPFYKVHTAIHHLIRFLKNGEERPNCKKIMRKYPLRRDTVKNFKTAYPDEYKTYKEDIQKYYWKQ